MPFLLTSFFGSRGLFGLFSFDLDTDLSYQIHLGFGTVDKVMEKLFLRITEMSSLTAYSVVFAILIACGLGFPLPEDVPLIASGYLIWEGTMEWFPALVVAMAGVLLGDTILFFVGRKIGKQLLQGDRVKTFFPPERVRRVRAYFRKYGDKLVFFARFVAGLRAIVFFMAGAMKMKYWRFIWLDGMAALISVPLWIFLGWFLGHLFGDEISKLLKSMKDIKTAFTVVVVLIVSGFVLHNYRKFAQAKKLKKLKRKKASA